MTETVFTLLGQEVTGYGLGMAAALALTLLCMLLWCLSHRAGYGVFIRFASLAIPLTLLVSRLVYVLADCTYYLTTLSNPALALRFWDGGYSLTGALLGLTLAAFLAQRLLKCQNCLLVDGAGLSMPLGITVERLCENGTGTGMGKSISTDALMFLGIEDPLTGEWVHPVYLYEAAAAMLIFFALLVWLWTRRGKKTCPGDLLLLFYTLFGTSQTVLECLRNDLHMVVHFIPIQQVIALLMALSALGIWTHRLTRNRRMKKSRLIQVWVAAALCVATAVVMEFLLDRGEQKLLYFCVITACMTVLAVLTLRCGMLSRREEGVSPQ